MSAAETTPPRLITHTDGDATFDHLLERQERREERSSSLDPENSHEPRREPAIAVPLVPALSPLSALANASFADDTGSPGSGSSVGSGAFLVAASSAEDARARRPPRESSSSSSPQ